MADSQKCIDTINILPSAPAETKSESGITVACDGQGIYTITGNNSTQNDIYVSFLLENEITIPISVGQGGQGTFSMFNNVSSDKVILQLYNDQTTVDTWILSPANRNNSVYSAMGTKKLNKIGFRIVANSGALSIVCSPMFTNDGQLPTSFVPHKTWQHSLRKLTTATEAVENPLYSDGTAITAYTLKGNTTTSGTPTPSNPITINGVGEKTANLTTVYSPNTSSSGGLNFEAIGDKLRIYGTTSTYVQCINTNDIILPSGTYTFSISSSIGNTAFYAQFRSVDGTTTYATITNTTTITFNEATTGRIRVIISATESTPYATDEVISIMINTGSTAKPYEPYGYKIPISSGGVTTNIYLGSTQTTRQVKKLVLDGTENWNENLTNYGYRFGLNVSDSMQSDTQDVRSLCTHLPLTVRGGTGLDVQNVYVISASNDLIIKLSNSDRVSDLKTWLAQQYAAGTPVTVWYVLATPETAAVNEPLMKIGDYVDTLSNAASIPTTEGANSITVDTTVQPSEFTATWTGWHNAEVKEKSANLFDYKTMSGGKTDYYLDENGNEVINTGFWSITKYIPVNGTVFTITRTFGGNAPAICLYDSNLNFLTGVAYQGEQVVTISSSTNASYIRFSYFRGTPLEDIAHDMLNTGSTALPYEPYWK